MYQKHPKALFTEAQLSQQDAKATAPKTLAETLAELPWDAAVAAGSVGCLITLGTHITPGIMEQLSSVASGVIGPI